MMLERSNREADLLEPLGLPLKGGCAAKKVDEHVTGCHGPGFHRVGKTRCRVQRGLGADRNARCSHHLTKVEVIHQDSLSLVVHLGMQLSIPYLMTYS